LSSIRVPSFLTKIDKAHKVELIRQWSTLKGYECIDLLKESLEQELDKLIEEDERSSATWFQTKWGRAKRLGRREQLRKMIKDLT
tara:strand:+ start:4882 stop:5136 length:255 start_codon:yes stop_codon:yes gene_type:complete